MAYLFRQKLNILELAGREAGLRRVLIYEPEEYLGALYRHYLRMHNFDVKHCPVLGQARQAIADFEPDVFVFCADSESAGTASEIWKLLPYLGADFPGLRMVSTGLNSSNEIIRRLMEAGVLGHINRKLSRPQDLAIVVKSIL
jgi:hypothetical protein